MEEKTILNKLVNLEEDLEVYDCEQSVEVLDIIKTYKIEVENNIKKLKEAYRLGYLDGVKKRKESFEREDYMMATIEDLKDQNDVFYKKDDCCSEEIITENDNKKDPLIQTTIYEYLESLERSEKR